MKPPKFLLGALAAALALACFLSPFASRLPDGLDKFAADHGVRETHVWKKAPLAEYNAPVAASLPLRTGLAGGIGTLLVFGLLFFGGKLLAPGRPAMTSSPPRTEANGG